MGGASGTKKTFSRDVLFREGKPGRRVGETASLGIFGSLRMTFPGGNGKILRLVILLKFCSCCLILLVKNVTIIFKKKS